LSFCIDVVTFRDTGDRGLVQINCSISNDQIRFVETDEGDATGSLKIVSRFESLAGDVVDEAERQVEVGARSMLQAEERNVIQMVQLDRKLSPGHYRLTVSVTDLNAPKVGLWYAVRGIKRSGEVRCEVRVPDLRARALGISGITFARYVRTDSTGGEFSRSGIEIIPNPSRLYGLRLPDLSVYFEVYDGREGHPADTLTAEYVVLDNEGRRVLGQTRVLVGESRWWPKAFSLPLVGLPEGSYTLAVNIEDPRTMNRISTEERFDVMWSMLSWDRDLRDGLEELSLILTEEEIKVVEALSPGERESFMRAYWKKLDPTPETLQNESLQEYYRRVKFANENYSSYRKGILTDQGRIYIKYGPPDDIRRDADWGINPGLADVVSPGLLPSQRTVDEEGLHYEEMGMDETGREAERLDNVRTMGKTYEIWIYDRGGRPISGEYALKGSGNKMKFVYVDERGYGDLHLVYSSVGEDY